MPEPDEIRFACIGCGAMNPAGSTACSGCGHLFAGPGDKFFSKMSSIRSSPPSESLELYRSRRQKREPTILGCIGKSIAIIVTIVAAFFAFVYAFFTTCVSVASNQYSLYIAGLAGLVAAGTVVGVALWISALSNKDG